MPYCIVVSHQNLEWFQVPRLRTLSEPTVGCCLRGWDCQRHLDAEIWGYKFTMVNRFRPKGHYITELRFNCFTLHYHTSKAPQFSVQRCWSSWLQATASKGSAELDQCRWLVLNTKLSPCSLDLVSILWFKTPGSSSSLHLEDSTFPRSWDLYMWNGQAAALCACT